MWERGKPNQERGAGEQIKRERSREERDRNQLKHAGRADENQTEPTP